MQLSIYRGSTVNLLLKVKDTSATVSRLNGEDTATLLFDSDSVADLAIGDYVYLFNRRYTLNLLPAIKKTSSAKYEYSCVFEGIMYELSKVLYQDLNGSAEFSLTGNLQFFVNLIASNLNRIGTGWSATAQANTIDKTLTFNNENCLQVLQRLCQEYAIDFNIADTKVITAAAIGQVRLTSFAYGKGKGLYSLTRNTVSSKNIFTRLYAQGATRNIPGNYRNYSQRLKLAAPIEKNINTYGTIEASVTYDDIYPRFIGPITWVDAANPLKFRISTLDFDINSYLTAAAAKVHFNSGALSGYEFDIVTYSHTNREFTIKVNQSEKALTVPSAILKPAVGDKVVFLDITMPDSYITAAETELQARAQTHLDQNCNPRVSYTLDIDPVYMRDNLVTFEVGDHVNVKDTALSIDKNVRVVSIDKNIQNPYRWKVELSDLVEPSVISRTIASVEDIARMIVVNRLNDPARARRGWLNAQELQGMVFDTDGYFDAENIRPLSITTNMLAVGATSQQLTLSSTIIGNYQGDKSKVFFGVGELVHLSIESQPRTWNISQTIQTGLNDASSYYIYAKCTRSNANTGILVADTAKRTTEGDPTYYYFLIGVLNSVVSGVRGISLTYGFTTINGRFITTGRIQSVGGTTYFDLDAGEIGGKIIFSSGKSDTMLEGEINAAAIVANSAYDVADSAQYKAANASDSASYALNAANYAQGLANSAQIVSGSAQAAATTALQNAAQAQILAESKTKHNTTQPAGPYSIGDTWANGQNFYQCITARSSGFSQSDWALATNYDSAQTLIDGGLVSTGSIRLLDIYGVEWAGMRGAPGAGGSATAIWAGGSLANLVVNPFSVPFRVTHNGWMYSSKGVIGGLSIDVDALFYGTKKTDDGYSSDGITIAGNGSIHSKNFYINTDGSAGLRGVFKTAETGQRIELLSAGIMSFYNQAGDYIKIDNDGNGNPFIKMLITGNIGSCWLSANELTIGRSTSLFNVDTKWTPYYNRLHVIMQNLPSAHEVELEESVNWKILYQNINTGTVAHQN